MGAGAGVGGGAASRRGTVAESIADVKRAGKAAPSTASSHADSFSSHPKKRTPAPIATYRREANHSMPAGGLFSRRAFASRIASATKAPSIPTSSVDQKPSTMTSPRLSLNVEHDPRRIVITAVPAHVHSPIDPRLLLTARELLTQPDVIEQRVVSRLP